jgi:hypothetical protein
MAQSGRPLPDVPLHCRRSGASPESKPVSKFSVRRKSRMQANENARLPVQLCYLPFQFINLSLVVVLAAHLFVPERYAIGFVGAYLIPDDLNR